MAKVQLLRIEEFVLGKDTFVSLPTGYGKSLIYSLLPAVYDRMRGHTTPTSVALIVGLWSSPMTEQKKQFLPRGISLLNSWVRFMLMHCNE